MELNNKKMEQEMISDEDVDKVFSNKYYKLIKFLQTAAGIWPFLSTSEKSFQQLIIYLSLAMMIYPLVS